jgi:hypothetical protein
VADWRIMMGRLQAWVESEWAKEEPVVRAFLLEWVQQHGGWESVLRPHTTSLNGYMAGAVCADFGPRKRVQNLSSIDSLHMGFAVIHQTLEAPGTAKYPSKLAQVLCVDPLRMTKEGHNNYSGKTRGIGWMEPYHSQKCDDDLGVDVWSNYHAEKPMARNFWRKVVSVPAGFPVQGAVTNFSHGAQYACAVSLFLSGSVPPSWIYQAAQLLEEWDNFMGGGASHPISSHFPQSSAPQASSAGGGASAAPSKAPKLQLTASSHTSSHTVAQIQDVFLHCTGQATPRSRSSAAFVVWLCTALQVLLYVAGPRLRLPSHVCQAASADAK